MSKPLTMTVEREAWIREHGTGVTPQSWQPGVTMLRDVLAEVDALRAALAAAEAALADERRQLTAALEAERLHADALAHRLNIVATGHDNRVEFIAHVARRAAEVANG